MAFALLFEGLEGADLLVTTILPFVEECGCMVGRIVDLSLLQCKPRYKGCVLVPPVYSSNIKREQGGNWERGEVRSKMTEGPS